MARGGGPSARARRIKESATGILVSPRMEDLRAREEWEQRGGSVEAACAVCGHPVSVAAESFEFVQAGYEPICTYDAERFRSVLGFQVTSPEVDRVRQEMRQRFAEANGVPVEAVQSVLPPELRWLEDMGVE